MTTLKKVIERTDALKPNVFTESQKRDWIYALEVQLREFRVMYDDREADMLFLNDENSELILPRDKDDAYVYYLMAMMDLANEDIAMYNNNIAMANELVKAFQKQYRRENLPKKNTKITEKGASGQ